MSVDRSCFAEKYLIGRGVEFGALHNPLIIGNQSEVVYVDQFSKSDLLKNFPELESLTDSIVTTDIILNLDSGDFFELKNQDFNFFIANHLIEHLVNPILFLEKIHDVMLPGAVLYLAVPNKEHTFDSKRELTTNDHLWQEYQEKINDLSEEHLNDFLLNITKDHIEPERRAKMYFKNDKLPFWGFRRRRIHNLHRERSIHVHVWNHHTFDTFLDFTIAQLKLQFAIVDSNLSDGGNPPEMIYILRRT